MTRHMPQHLHIVCRRARRVHAACARARGGQATPAGLDLSRVVVEPPRDARHGDMATNAAMVLAKEAGRSRATSPS